jgi:hypothetical protein
VLGKRFDPASTAMCEHDAVQFTRLRPAGTPVGVNDLWITCHALADGCTLVTNNTHLPNLQTQSFRHLCKCLVTAHQNGVHRNSMGGDHHVEIT